MIIISGIMNEIIFIYIESFNIFGIQNISSAYLEIWYLKLNLAYKIKSCFITEYCYSTFVSSSYFNIRTVPKHNFYLSLYANYNSL